VHLCCCFCFRFYHHAWEESKDIPDAYERLILDVIQGEKSLFIRDDELAVAWEIFSGALHELESDPSLKPVPYEFGSKGPRESNFLAQRCGVNWSI
jgi:glucose-6-phosphate 1-dehydrogenase